MYARAVVLSLLVLGPPDGGSPLLIETPNTSSRWGIGTTQRVAWMYHGTAPEFRIEVSRADGRWERVAEIVNVPGPEQNFYWDVTGPATPDARLRVTAIGDEKATDVNDADIRIDPAGIRIIAPNADTTARAGMPLTVTWSHNLGARKPVAIEASDDGGETWRTVEATTKTRGSDTSTYPWMVTLGPTAHARLRVRALDGSGAAATSASFRVTSP